MRRDEGRLNSALQRQMQAREVDADRFVRMLSTGVLHRIRVDGQLMHPAEDDGVRVFRAQRLTVNSPAFRRAVVVGVARRSRGLRHAQAAARANRFSWRVHRQLCDSAARGPGTRAAINQ